MRPRYESEGHAVGSHVVQHVLFIAATHSMLTRCDDAIHFHFDVSLQMSAIMIDIFL